MSDSYGPSPVLPLPAELLLYIFKLATVNPCRDIDRYVNLPPFESIETGRQEEEFDVALKTKRSIVHTCSAFNHLGKAIMYEDIRVGRGAAVLMDILEKSEVKSPGAGIGRMVKRAVLFPLASETSAPGRISKSTLRILAYCPNIRALCRHKGAISHDGECGAQESGSSHQELYIHSLERVDWSSCPADDPPFVAEMPHSVWGSESLKTLSVGVQEWSRFTGMQETDTVNIFSNIRTLRVRSIDAFGLPGQRFFTLELPSFRRLILDQPDSLYALFSVIQYGDKVDTIELGLHSGFLEHDYITVLLIYCPNVMDLYFPVFTTFVTRRNGLTYSLRHVALHAATEEGLFLDVTRQWEHLCGHFEALCGDGSRFTALERITLHGTEWRNFVGDPRFIPSARLIRSRGIALFIEDETARLLFDQVNPVEVTL
ncbi:hypothetical protein ACEPAI_8275 [Sanghuangporus weigelae]